MITLNGQTFRTALMDGRRVVLERRGRAWRIAKREQSEKILAGMSCSILTNIVPLRTVPDATKDLLR